MKAAERIRLIEVLGKTLRNSNNPNFKRKIEEEILKHVSLL